MTRTYHDEAAECRRYAEEVEGAPDRALLLRLAVEFDRLADLAGTAPARVEDPAYYATRASQEVTAAVKAKHPQARLAHLAMARRYDALAHAHLQQAALGNGSSHRI